jgi:4-amino-4-deoxy-L-arabinose transferase-like glycosyltransferase
VVQKILKLLPTARVSLFDLCVAVVLVGGGLAYHWDCTSWGRYRVGNVPYGDAEFWWNGAVHVSEGLFGDYPYRGYRHGYFVLTGLTFPVLGTRFDVYHKFFAVDFLAACVAFYLCLRGPLGRPGACCAAALVVFNPFTAEWLSTTTSEGTGLLLHLLSLACLLRAVNRGLHPGWLCGFGILFGLATLTRPLLSPFLGMVVLGLFLLPAAPWKRCAGAAACAAAAFAVPLLPWLAVQRAWTGEWSISTNDATAFYAASDPQIQTWNVAMYDRVVHLARDGYGRADLLPADYNRVFWQQTLANYRKYHRYHQERLLPHLWEVADFMPRRTGPPRHLGDFWKSLLLTALAAALSLRLLGRGEWVRAVVVAAIAGCLWLSPHTAGFLTCSGVLLALLLAPGEQDRLGVFLLGCYWLTGVLCLYLTGGTSGPPLEPAVSLTGLGYRLGSQVFFMGDVLGCFFLLRLAGPAGGGGPRPQPSGRWAGWVRLGKRFWAEPDVRAGRGVLGGLGAVAAGTVVVLAVGGVVVARRCAAACSTPPTTYPDLAPVVEFASRLGAGSRQAPHLYTDFWSLWGGLAPGGAGSPDSGDVVLTGTGSGFVWNLPGQERSQMRLYHQDKAAPFTMGPWSLMVELPRHFPAGYWEKKQGAFILRRLDESQTTGPAPCHTSVPTVRVFVPLTPDRSGYDLGAAVVFPLVKYASQLHKVGELVCTQGALTWANDSGNEPDKRRFLLGPDRKGGAGTTVRLRVDTARACGRTRLRFAYDWKRDAAAGAAAPESGILVRVRAERPSPGAEELLCRTEEATAGRLHVVDLDLTGRDASSVEIEFANLPRGAAVWLYELNLQADDFRPAR